MNRRDLVLLLAGAMTATGSLGAQQKALAQKAPAKIPRVGILTTADNERTPALDAFRAGLHDLGYVEGRNIILEFRFAGGDRSRGLELATELVALPVDVIVSEGFAPDTVAATDLIPIVSPTLMDPVQEGFALSLARPGGNITGFTLMHTELNGKRLELLRTAFPQITAVSALVNPANRTSKYFEQTETAARALGLGNLRRVEAESAAVLHTLRPAVFSGADAVIVLPDGVFYHFRQDVVALVNEAHLPAIYPERDYADDGGLMA